MNSRTEAAIRKDILGVYCSLSPENLHCDGEISAAAARRKAEALRKQLQALFTELGRPVSESEAYGFTG